MPYLKGSVDFVACNNFKHTATIGEKQPFVGQYKIMTKFVLAYHC